MPSVSKAQSRLVRAKAAEGEAWAKEWAKKDTKAHMQKIPEKVAEETHSETNMSNPEERNEVNIASDVLEAVDKLEQAYDIDPNSEVSIKKQIELIRHHAQDLLKMHSKEKEKTAQCGYTDDKPLEESSPNDNAADQSQLPGYTASPKDPNPTTSPATKEDVKISIAAGRAEEPPRTQRELEQERQELKGKIATIVLSKKASAPLEGLVAPVFAPGWLNAIGGGVVGAGVGAGAGAVHHYGNKLKRKITGEAEPTNEMSLKERMARYGMIGGGTVLGLRALNNLMGTLPVDNVVNLKKQIGAPGPDASTLAPYGAGMGSENLRPHIGMGAGFRSSPASDEREGV